jgi:hypothetical protein
VGIVGGLVYTGSALRRDAKARQVENLFALTKQHREIWSMLADRPELSRIMEVTVDLTATPVTRDEELFVTFLIFHLSNAYRAAQAGLFIGPEKLREDIRRFLPLPIPRTIWEKSIPLQDKDFVHFVESGGSLNRS